MDQIKEKATYSDIGSQLSQQLPRGYIDEFDFNSNTVYVREWSDPYDQNNTYRYTFTVTNSVAKLDLASKQMVVRETLYKDVPDEMVTKSWLKDFISSILTKKEDFEIIKAIQEEQMISVEVFYPPAGVADLHGDGIEDVEVLKTAIESFNQAVTDGRAKPCLFHSHETKAYEYGKAWVTEKAMEYGDGILPAGTPLIEIHWKNLKAWELRKNGTLLSGSMRGMAGV